MGPASLTRPLAATGVAIRAIEVDRDLAAALAEWAPPTLSLVTGDFLALDDAGVLPAGSGAVRVVGNLPYNLSTPILFRVLALVPAPSGSAMPRSAARPRDASTASSPAGSGDYGRWR
jgi:16S rRNA (adenine1518-N6/adenine1519-N6)-dimethyltransferase